MAQPQQTGIRLNKKGKPSIIHWRGLFYNAGRRGRVMAFIATAVFIASLSFTQLGFIGLGVVGDYSGYSIILLAPIAFGALALGVGPGTLLGLVSGILMYAHAQIQPLDYYEMSYITPGSSILLFTVTAFFLSLFLAIALRKNPPLWRRIIYFALICSFVSFMFTLTFSIGVFLQLIVQIGETIVQTGVEPDDMTVRLYAIEMMGRLGSIGQQLWIDAGFMFVTCVAGDLVLRKIAAFKGSFSLGTQFRGWLLLVVSLAFAITAGVGFVVITEQSKESARQSMQDEIAYLANQLDAYDKRNEELADILVSDAQSDKAISESETAKLESAFSLDTLLDGYSKEADGTIVILEGDKVLLSDDPNYQVGTTLDDYLGFSGAEEALASASSLDEVMLQVAYDENMLTKADAMAIESFDDYEERSSTQMSFVCFGQHDEYSIMMIMPATKVFAGRNATMAWVSLSAFVLLVVVFLLVSRLLSLVVVRRIDETNGVLGEITDGNLDARVDIRDSREFSSLSTGINTTVDALKDSIAEAASRMDAELATAKAIQESALPRIFPPYPDIEKFDVYATMNAAREVGGDFYDFFLIGDEADSEAGKLGFVIADVSGKGVPAALFMMKAKTQLRDYLASGMEPGEAVENANRQLCDGNDEGMFVTVWAGVLDYATGHVEYVNAGHNPPLLWSFDEAESEPALNGESATEGSWRWLTEKSGLPLGLFDGFPYEAHSIDCKVGDQFLLYTDGVTEAMSAAGELYGEDRLEAIVNEAFESHPRSLVDAVRRDVARHAAGAEQSDDITVLALEVGVPPEITSTLVVPADDARLAEVNDFIHTELDRRLCPLRAQKQLDIAVEELFVNVCHYAYGGEWNQSDGTVRVSYTYSAEPPSIVVAIADDGVPYNPLEKPDAVTPDDIMDVPIGGLGILMAKNSVDDMTYERVDGSNVVTIVKKW